VKDLRIEFRAVPYTDTSRVLEYRFSPNQDLSYKKEYWWLWGLIRFSLNKRYSTKWRYFEVFKHRLFANYKSKDSKDNYLPIFCNTQKELDWYKTAFHTYGEFFTHIEKGEEEEKKKYDIAREKYLEKQRILY